MGKEFVVTLLEKTDIQEKVDAFLDLVDDEYADRDGLRDCLEEATRVICELAHIEFPEKKEWDIEFSGTINVTGSHRVEARTYEKAKDQADEIDKDNIDWNMAYLSPDDVDNVEVEGVVLA